MTNSNSPTAEEVVAYSDMFELAVVEQLDPELEATANVQCVKLMGKLLLKVDGQVFNKKTLKARKMTKVERLLFHNLIVREINQIKEDNQGGLVEARVIETAS